MEKPDLSVNNVHFTFLLRGACVSCDVYQQSSAIYCRSLQLLFPSEWPTMAMKSKLRPCRDSMSDVAFGQATERNDDAISVSVECISMHSRVVVDYQSVQLASGPSCFDCQHKITSIRNTPSDWRSVCVSQVITDVKTTLCVAKPARLTSVAP